MAIKNTDKVVVIDSSVDTTPRKSELINDQAQADTVNDLAGAMSFSVPNVKAYPVTIPVITAGTTHTLTVNLGAIGNPDAVIIGSCPATSGYTIENIENFATASFVYHEIMPMGNNYGSRVQPSFANKYTAYGSGDVSNYLFRVSEDYLQSRTGRTQKHGLTASSSNRYDQAGTEMPHGFTYAETGVSTFIGWYDYFGTKGPLGIIGKKVTMQAAWIEQDGDNTNLKIVLNNVDTTDTVSSDIHIVRLG